MVSHFDEGTEKYDGSNPQIELERPIVGRPPTWFPKDSNDETPPDAGDEDGYSDSDPTFGGGGGEVIAITKDPHYYPGRSNPVIQEPDNGGLVVDDETEVTYGDLPGSSFPQVEEIPEQPEEDGENSSDQGLSDNDDPSVLLFEPPSNTRGDTRSRYRQIGVDERDEHGRPYSTYPEEELNKLGLTKSGTYNGDIGSAGSTTTEKHTEGSPIVGKGNSRLTDWVYTDTSNGGKHWIVCDTSDNILIVIDGKVTFKDMKRIAWSSQVGASQLSVYLIDGANLKIKHYILYADGSAIDKDNATSKSLQRTMDSFPYKAAHPNGNNPGRSSTTPQQSSSGSPISGARGGGNYTPTSGQAGSPSSPTGTIPTSGGSAGMSWSGPR